MRALTLLALCSCTPLPAEPVESKPCTTYVVTELGDTVAFVELEVPPENLNAVTEWWTEGCGR